ncbi:2282_t:CDS:2 [Funneliformis caledonium]|uniref:2282_t:CDS:1 n=1 Tax=Funneliformis caledonium TaxID=1117310 RepID=A0A9N9HXA7_9GLOM|nr:2282_t:CDS:2 [Funneliformis caledonium]
MTKPRLSLFSLPTETLLQIISFLGSAHLKQLSLTSRSLHSLTPNYLFKTVVVYNISRFFLQKLVPKYGQHFRTLNVQGRASQEFIDQLAALLKILDDYCDRLENFNIIVLEQKPGLLEINAPCFSQSLYRYRSKSLKLTCSAQLITFLDSSDLGLLVHAVIQSVWSLNHYTEIYGSQITRARLSFEGLSDVWVLELFNNCPNLQELVLERKYLDDNIEITDATLKGLCDLSNTLKSLSFISECNSPVTEYFTPAGWKRMLIGTPNLEKLDISGLDLYFTANLLPLIAVHYRSRPLCYITDDVIRCLAMYSPGLIRLCLNGDLLNNRKLSLDLIEKRLVNLETFYTWNLIPEKWPNGLYERFGKLRNEYNLISYLRRASVDSQIRNRSRRVFSIKKHGQLIIIAIFFLISYYFTIQGEIK